jgi:hypothetical protein
MFACGVHLCRAASPNRRNSLSDILASLALSCSRSRGSLPPRCDMSLIVDRIIAGACPCLNQPRTMPSFNDTKNSGANPFQKPSRPAADDPEKIPLGRPNWNHWAMNFPSWSKIWMRLF